MTFTSQQFLAAYKKLPEQVQAFLASQEATDSLSAINNQYGVDASHVRELGQVTGYIAVGLLKNTDFITEMKARIPHMSPDFIAKMQSDVDAAIFKKIETLPRNYKGDTEEETEDETPASESIQTADPKNPTRGRLIDEIENPHSTPMRTIAESHPEISEIKPAPSYQSATAPAPSNLPMEYHDPMPITISADPEKKPLIDTSVPQQAPKPTFAPDRRPSLSDESKRMVGVPKIESSEEKYSGADPYREAAE